jgi:hypothetical protein
MQPFLSALMVCLASLKKLSIEALNWLLLPYAHGNYAETTMRIVARYGPMPPVSGTSTRDHRWLAAVHGALPFFRDS